MVKVLILFYSTYGHIYQMAESIAKGASMVSGSQVTLKRVRETLPNDVLEKLGAVEAQKQFDHVPILSDTNELSEYDVIFFGTPTRFGNMSAQMKTFIDSLGSLWSNNLLVGKVASVFTSSGTIHGGSETTITTFIPTLLHLGFIYVGLPYTCTLQNGVGEVKGGSPYGSATIAGGDGSRQPSNSEKKMAEFQGKHATSIGNKLFSSNNNNNNNNKN
jgi:NAD(P)H dehydrogenase (quinone)